MATCARGPDIPQPPRPFAVSHVDGLEARQPSLQTRSRIPFPPRSRPRQRLPQLLRAQVMHHCGALLWKKWNEPTRKWLIEPSSHIRTEMWNLGSRRATCVHGRTDLPDGTVPHNFGSLLLPHAAVSGIGDLGIRTVTGRKHGRARFIRRNRKGRTQFCRDSTRDPVVQSQKGPLGGRPCQLGTS